MTTIAYLIVLLAYVSLPYLDVSAVTRAPCLRCRRIFNSFSAKAELHFRHNFRHRLLVTRTRQTLVQQVEVIRQCVEVIRQWLELRRLC